MVANVPRTHSPLISLNPLRKSAWRTAMWLNKVLSSRSRASTARRGVGDARGLKLFGHALAHTARGLPDLLGRAVRGRLFGALGVKGFGGMSRIHEGECRDSPCFPMFPLPLR